MLTRRTPQLGAGALALLSGIVVPQPSIAGAAAGPPVAVRLTVATPTRLTKALAIESSISFGGPPCGSIPIVDVRPERTYQRIDGFGAALTHASASLINRSTQRATIINDLFSAAGARLNLIRMPIGTSDFPAREGAGLHEYTFNDIPIGQSDFGLTRFSVAGDTRHMIPVIRSIRAVQPGLGIVAAPWSAPAWMKSVGASMASAQERTTFSSIPP